MNSSTPEKIPVRLVDISSNKSTDTSVHIQHWNIQERRKRGLKFAVISFVLAFCSIFLPLAHYLLVPGFLIAIPFAARYAYRQTSAVVGGEGICPSCAELFPVVKATDPVFPFSDVCEKCHRAIRIEKA